MTLKSKIRKYLTKSGFLPHSRAGRLNIIDEPESYFNLDRFNNELLIRLQSKNRMSKTGMPLSEDLQGRRPFKQKEGQKMQKTKTKVGYPKFEIKAAKTTPVKNKTFPPDILPSEDERCFACGKKLGKRKAHGAHTDDEQNVFVGSECYKLILAAGRKGYQPKRGGPRLFPDWRTKTKTQVKAAKEGAFTYEADHAIKMCSEWLKKYAKSNEPRDFNVFLDWLKRLKSDVPILKKIGFEEYKFELERDTIKKVLGFLDMLDTAIKEQKAYLVKDYFSKIQALVYTLKFNVYRGWSPKADKGKIIMLQLLDDGVLGIRWAGDRRWTEIRGKSYWKYNPKEKLHQLIDKITGNISEFMNGTEISITPAYSEYELFKDILLHPKGKWTIKKT